MNLLNEFLAWLGAPATRPALFSALVLFIAMLASGILAAFIARRALRGIVEQRDREGKIAVIAAVIDAAAEASVWNSLTPQEQVLSDRAVAQTELLMRLLPIRGADVAASWASHELRELKRRSATFGYQLEPAVEEFRDRLIEWQKRPHGARRGFLADLNQWKLVQRTPESALQDNQDTWVAVQHHERFSATHLEGIRPTTTETAPAATEKLTVSPRL